MSNRRTPLMDISNNDVMSSPVATGSRRKSGRAVKAPEKFVPDAPFPQQGHGSTKRKREGEDVENGVSDSDSEDEDNDTAESEEDEEEVKELRKKAKPARKPAAKKPKVNGTVSHDEAPAVKLPSRPKKGKKAVIADINAEGLYAEVFTSDENLEDVASEFLTRWADDKEAALTDLLNLLIKSAGCPILLTEDEANDPENVDTKIGDLQEEYQAQNISDYPLISKAKGSHAFRTSLVDFFESLVKRMHTSEVMYEATDLLENIHLWTATMTSCPSRPFRHTATVVALSITSAICAVVKEEVQVAAQVRRQLEGEKKKKGTNKGRLAEFQKKIEVSESKKEFLEDKIKDFFDTVYVHRYRDVDPKIRTECVDALGSWILTLPSMFFEGTYLRYMGWMLSDTHAPVRHEVIKQLHRIMKNEANYGQMRHFIERFRPRLIEMATQDAESGVRASAVELIDLVRQAGMLEPDDIDAIGKLVFDSEPKVRKAVISFLVESMTESYRFKVEELGGEEDLGELLTIDDEDFDSPRGDWIKLKVLAEILSAFDAEDEDDMPSQTNNATNDSNFLKVSATESRFTLAAQALYEQTPEIRDWEMLGGYLLFDHSAKPSGNKILRALKQSFKPTEKEEIILLEILNAVVKLSLTQDDLDKTKDKSKKKNARSEMSEAKETTARRLAELIPKLLRKFGANPKTATVVLRLEHVLNLGVFQELRQDSTAYAKLLDGISVQFNGHADKGVLSEAGAALLHARGYDELEEVTENKMQSLWEDTINTLQRINKAGEVSVRGSFRESVLTELSHTLARIDKLASISNCVEPLEAEGSNLEPMPINIVLDVVDRGTFEEEDPGLDVLEDEVALSAMRSSMFYFMWKVHALTESVSAGEEISDLEIEHLKQRQETFIANLISALSSRATLDPVRLFGTGTLLDLHVLFATLRPMKKSRAKNGAIGEPSDYMQSLVKEIPPDVQQELTSIFDQSEKHFAKKSKKKLAEPAEDDAPEDLDSEPEDEDDEDTTATARRAQELKAEQQLCDLTGKLVLAILAKVIDASGPLEGKLRSRILRNRGTLGHNFKEVAAYLDDPKQKNKKSHKSKAQQIADAMKKTARSAEIAQEEEDEEEEEEEEDPFAHAELEGDAIEDLRRRELLDDEPAEGASEDNEDADSEEDDIMGD